ncbi:hypothetical protein CRG98_037678 [Punica granatum]|uniref:Uncharacterized protein n=1 Tax=Punica granatum TaxID=22663 RepID=A0A2I0ID59_PUNGR|nr:hypothetical protein CRG98_037678 [Punica granatum]
MARMPGPQLGPPDIEFLSSITRSNSSSCSNTTTVFLAISAREMYHASLNPLHTSKRLVRSFAEAAHCEGSSAFEPALSPNPSGEPNFKMNPSWLHLILPWDSIRCLSISGNRTMKGGHEPRPPEDKTCYEKDLPKKHLTRIVRKD